MFSTIVPLASKTGRTRRATVVSVPDRHERHAAPPTIEEAYELRLLAEVARWDDQAAFEEIHARHRTAVTRAAFAVCRDAEAAEDITQQTFTALWIRAQRLVDKAVRLRPWLMTVARNAAIDHLRADRATVAFADASNIASCEPQPDRYALARESAAELAFALATLSDEQRAALELVYIGGMTYVAAAAVIGEPVGTIKSRVRLAVGHLRERFADRLR